MSCLKLRRSILPGLYPWSVLLLAVTVVSLVSSTLLGQSVTEGSDSVSRTPRLVQQVLNDDLGEIKQQHAFDRLLAKEGDERDEALVELVLRGSERFAPSAAHQLLEDPSPEEIAAIANTISSWSPLSQQSILSTLLRYRIFGQRGDLILAIPIKVLQKTLESDSAPVPNDSSTSGLAALTLATRGTPSDRDLLRRTAHRISESRSVWLALAADGRLDEELQDLARQIYQDEGRNLPLRVAAASALADVDQSAATFARRQVEQFIDQHRDESMAPLLQKLWEDEPEARETYGRLRENLPLLGALRVLPAGIAEPLSVRGLGSSNEEIRQTTALVCALRWPERLTPARVSELGLEAKAGLVALADALHCGGASVPQSLRAEIDAELLEKARKKLAEDASVLGFYGGQLALGL